MSQNFLSLKKILSVNRVDGVFFSHISMIEPKGSFQLNRQSIEPFWNSYCNIVKNNPELPLGIGEKPQHYLPVLVDVDLKIKTEEDLKEPIYSQTQLQCVIEIYQSILRKIIDNIQDENLMCFVLEKPSYRSGEYIKNGFHLHFPYTFLSKTDQEGHLIPRVRKLIEENNIFEDYDVNKIIDSSYTRNCWLLYGSKKDKNLDSYKLTKIINSNGDEITLKEAVKNYLLYDIEENIIDIQDKEEFYLPRILSIFPSGRKTCELKANLNYPVKEFLKREQRKEEKEEEEEEVKDEDTLNKTEKELKKIVSKIKEVKPDYFDSYENWFKLCCIFKYELGMDGWDLFNEICQDFEGYNEKRNYDLYKGRNRREKGKNLTKKSLYYIAIELGVPPEELKEEKKKKVNVELNEYDCAKYCYDEYKDNILYDEKVKSIFIFNEPTKKWKKIEKENFTIYFNDIILQYIYLYFENITLEEDEKQTLLQKCINQHKSRGKIVSISRFIVDIIIQHKEDSDFIKTNFNQKRWFLPIRDNKVINIIKKEVRERRKEDYFTYHIDIDYKLNYDREYTLNYFGELIIPNYHIDNRTLKDLTEKELKYIDNLINCIAYGFTGDNNLKRFYVFLGNTNHGKSMLLNLIGNILNPIASSVNKKVFKKSSSESSHNQETFSLIDNRISFVSELEEKDSFDETLIKSITGKDEINIRRCGGKENEKFILQTILLLITNEIPNFKCPAFSTRMKIFDFPNTFEKDTNKWEELLSKREDFFSLLIDYAYNIYNNNRNYTDVEEVVKFTRSIVDSKDSIKLFMDDSFEITNNHKDRINKTSLYQMYKNYIKSNSLEDIGRNKFYSTLEITYNLKVYNDRQFCGIKVIDVDESSINPLL